MQLAGPSTTNRALTTLRRLIAVDFSNLSKLIPLITSRTTQHIIEGNFDEGHTLARALLEPSNLQIRSILTNVVKGDAIQFTQKPIRTHINFVITAITALNYYANHPP